MRACKTEGCENPKAHFPSGLCWTCFHAITARCIILDALDSQEESDD